MKSCVHSPLTGNHPLAWCGIYSDLFREATGGGKVRAGQQSGKQEPINLLPHYYKQKDQNDSCCSLEVV